MAETRKLQEVLRGLLATGLASRLLATDASGNPGLVEHRQLVDLVFSTVSNAEDLDNPATKGVFTVGKDTVVTRPTKGKGWNYGFVFSLAKSTGVQLWLNFEGYIALRGRGTSGGDWSEWSVFAPM